MISAGLPQGPFAALRARLSSRFSRDVFATFATRVVVLAMGVGSSILTARLLGPEGRGVLAAAFTLTALGAQFGNFGLHAANTYFVSRDRTLLPALVSNSMIASYALVGPAVLAVLAVLMAFPGVSPLHGWPLILSMLLIPLSLSGLLLQNLLLGVGEIRTFNTVEVAGKALSIVILMAFFLAGDFSVSQLYAALFIPVIAGNIMALRRLGTGAPGARGFSRPLFLQTLGYGFKAYLAAFFSFLALRVNPLVINRMLGPADTGNFSIAATMGDLLYMFPTVLGTLLFPKLAAMTDERAKYRLVGRISLLVAAGMTVLCALAALLARPATVLLFGEEFLPAVPAFLWLLPGIVMLSVSTIFMNFFASIGFPPITLYSPALAAALCLLCNIVLLPRFGIVGASLASNAAYGLMMGLSLTYFYLKRRKI